MKDLDFDELDKAVNSLMTSVPKVSEPQKQDDETVEKTLDITPTLSEDDTPSFDKLNAAATAAASEASSIDTQKQDVVADVSSAMQTPPPAARRGGRFMDVVHPSSDMKKTVVPSRPVSRQGVTIDPGVRPSAPEVARSASVAEESSYEPYKSPAVESPTRPTVPEEKPAASVDNEWPDPLAMGDFKDDTLPKEEEWSSPVADGPLPVSYPDENDTPPLTSPFLPDTKVEKRPLGSGNDMLALLEEPEDEESVKEEPKPHEDKTVHDPSDQLPALPKDVEPLLPEELQGDLMAVESDTHMGLPKTETSHPETKKPEPIASTASESSSSTEPSQAPVGPASIPQQYREEPSTGDQQNGGIYDTETYHQPLAHAAKKKSGWMWVLWIIVILLVGAGSGAALYFLGII